MPAPEIIQQLVERFERNHDLYRSGNYNEARLRLEFLNPFFKALGWDIDNQQGYAEAYKDVIVEDTLEVEGAAKAPDYAFRIGGTRKFFVEAKKPAVNIQYDIYPAFQLRRYAWSAKLALSILTDFEEFAVYESRSKPDKSDHAATGRVLLLDYKQYLTRWDEIAAIFSREAVLRGSFDQYAAGIKGKKGTTEVDDAFLLEMEGWREKLARNIALRNPDLQNVRDLNYAVQMTIDRIVFLRICEDRGIEREEQLKEITDLTPGPSPEREGGSVYERLCQLFRQADSRYNSGLFHFSDEKNRSTPQDGLSLCLKIDDKVLKEIIADLYYPSPYVFKEIPADILGQVYERFLGKVIRLTPGHQAKVEEKPEVRKAGGVYYTPTYIVDYIVRNTVGKLLGPDPTPGPSIDGRAPSGEGSKKVSTIEGSGMTPREAAKLKILDPACGSGSFLLGAYQYLLDWHIQWYSEHDPQSLAKAKSPVIYQAAGGEWRLTTAEKKRILLNNIHGVDIDPQAVEVTKLSLSLKVLEGESQESMGAQLGLFKERALPDLGSNIKCGNSLIGPDYYEGHQLTMSFVDEEERYRVNAFNWKAAFPQVFIAGGFDAVIGNPPYGAMFTDDQKVYIKTVYKTYKYKFDSYIYFIEKAILLSKKRGYISFITPELWLKLENNDTLREYIANNAEIEKLLICGEKVFEEATVNTVVFCLHRGFSVDNILIENEKTSWLMPTTSWKKAPGYVIDYRVTPEFTGIIEKIRIFPLLASFGNAIQGITAYDKYRGQTSEMIKNRVFHSQQKKDNTYGKWLAGKDISRYSISWSGEWLSYGSWLAAPRDPMYFEGKRLLFREVPGIGKRIQATLTEETYYHGHSITPFKIFSENVSINLLYILGITNSKLISWYGGKTLSNFGKEIFPKLNPQDILAIPIRPIDFFSPTEKAAHDQIVSLVERLLELQRRLPSARSPQEKEMLQREIEATDAAIDGRVYELYGLTEEEIGIVEG